MKMNVYGMTIAALIGSLMLVITQTEATEFGFYPRVETGIMSYSIKYDAIANASLSVRREYTGLNAARKKIEYNDDLNTVSGGATFFINRFYIDLSAQYAFNGTDRKSIMYSTYEEAENLNTSYLTNRYVLNAHFDHRDRAIAVGYAVNRHFSVYVGYKWADLDFDSKTDGDIFHFYPEENLFLKTLVQSQIETRFEYKGPFIGATQGWEIDTLRYLKGLLSVKLGLAFLDSKHSADQINTFSYLNGTQVDSVEVWNYHGESDGDTWGFSLGLGWRGNTPITNLSYSLQFSGYRYNFNSDNPEYRNISETVINYKAGISYAF